MKTRLIASGMVLLGAVCCDGQTTTPVPTYSAVAFVRGLVSDPMGNPVQGAKVEITAFRGSACGGSPQTHASASTNSTGRYFAGLGVGLTEPFDGCINVAFAPPTGSDLRPAERSGVTVSFVRDGDRADTVEVSVTLTK